MIQESLTELENLISGKADSIEIIISPDISRELILEQLNNIIISLFPGCWTKGEFINEDVDYVIYDLHSEVPDLTLFSSIRIFDFGNKFKLVRV